MAAESTDGEARQGMKKIEVVIETEKTGEVREALNSIGVHDFAIHQIRRDTPGPVHCGERVQGGPPAEVMLEIVVSAERAAEVIRTLADSKWRSLFGGRKMFVYQVTGVVRPMSSETRGNPQ